MGIKARDVRAQLQGEVPPKVLAVLEALAEEQRVQREKTYELATMLDQMTDILQGITNMGEQMKKASEEILKKDSHANLGTYTP